MRLPSIHVVALVSLVALTSGLTPAAPFSAVLPDGHSSSEPADMSFDPGRFIYSDSLEFLRSLRARGPTGTDGVARRSTCPDRHWSVVRESVTDASGKKITLEKRVCDSPKVETIPGVPSGSSLADTCDKIDGRESDPKLAVPEGLRRACIARYIYANITSGEIPNGMVADDLIVGDKIPYSANWYPFGSGSTLANPNRTLGILGAHKFQNGDVRSFAPTSDDLLRWVKKGTVERELAKFPTPVLIDILNGKTDPDREDFYAFTRSEQVRINGVRDDFSTGNGILPRWFKAGIWLTNGMCESWSAAATNEPLPHAVRVRKKITSGSASGEVEFTLSAEDYASANAMLYHGLMFDDMDSTDPNKSPEEKKFAALLTSLGYRDMGDQCADDGALKDVLNHGAETSWTPTEQGDPHKKCNDLNFGSAVLVAANKIGAFGDLLYADFEPGRDIWHYPIAAIYLEFAGEAITDPADMQSDRAYGTYRQVPVNFYVLHSNASGSVNKGTFTSVKFPGRLDVTSTGRVIGGRWTSDAMLDYLVDVRAPILRKDNPLSVLKWAERESEKTAETIEIP